LSEKKGWWNFVLPVDVDGDGHLDLIAGNLGLNSRLKATTDQPVRLYYNDFDGNGRKEQILTYLLEAKRSPLPIRLNWKNKCRTQEEIFICRRFSQSFPERIIRRQGNKKASVLTADYFSSALCSIRETFF
jgi:hypothetical protein